MNENTIGRATYSPDDNKIRIYPDSRLPRDLYERVRANGFIWAPKQELFVAPMWTPDREDLAIELCGELEDEDTTLVDRAEQRAERFGEYSEHRAADAEQAHKAVAAIADNIPLGQPILVGHHSERHARRDAERIENGMRRAVKAWEQSKYWTDRAAGALRHAKYLERPDVRARRIKTIEADKRKQERGKAEAEHVMRFWQGKCNIKNQVGESKPIEIAEANRETICQLVGHSSDLGHYANWPGIDGDFEYSAWDVLRPDSERYSNCPSVPVAEVAEKSIASCNRCVAYCNRWIDHYDNRLAYEQAMLVASGGTATDRKGPEAGGAVKCWASVRGCWSYIQKVNRVSVTVLDNWGNGGGNFTRTIPFDKCFSIMTAAEVTAAREAGRLVETSCKTGFGLLDDTTASKATETSQERHERQHAEAVKAAAEPQGAKFEALAETLKAGVQVVTSPQLFPTPPDLAAQMVECADICGNHLVLEPSAGTGSLLRAISDLTEKDDCSGVVAVEINLSLAHNLASAFPKADIRRMDFLECNGDLGKFDRIIMNPPFDHGSDIEHIKHAINFLAEGGRLVALCANGPRQREALQPLADEWIDLPAGSFESQGTGVNVAMLVINR